MAQHGKIIVSQGYGMADVKAGIPNAPDTKFRIASVTKEFTAMAIMELQARGKLNIQDPVCKYVPDCPKDWAPITIYNLLPSSGIPISLRFPITRRLRPSSLHRRNFWPTLRTSRLISRRARISATAIPATMCWVISSNGFRVRVTRVFSRKTSSAHWI